MPLIVYLWWVRTDGVTGSPGTRLREMHWPEQVSEPPIHSAVLRNASDLFLMGSFQDVTATVPLVDIPEDQEKRWLSKNGSKEKQ